MYMCLWIYVDDKVVTDTERKSIIQTVGKRYVFKRRGWAMRSQSENGLSDLKNYELLTF